MTEVASGAVVDQRYKIVSRLGSGGMADVYLAVDQQLGRQIALKLLHRRFAADPGFVERFRREAQAAASLQHPNVVSVYDRGTYDGTYYIAMEYLPGRSLKQLIRDEAPLDAVRAVDITLQILKAARFAHRHGVVHRDLKPHNVIIDDADQAKVTDFGIARAGASDMTETGSIMGTAQYLSPEQAQGHAVGAGSDLYAIGVVLYEMVTGRVPFDGESAVTIALKHVSEAPTPASALNPAVPPELEHVILWALNKSPADRPRDADQFVIALEQAKSAIRAHTRGQPTASMAALTAVGGPPDAFEPPPVVPIPLLTPSPPAFPEPPPAAENGGNGTTGTIPPEQKRRRPWWPWAVLAVVLLLAGGGVAAYLLLRPLKTIVPAVAGEQVATAQARIQNANLVPNLQYRIASAAANTVIDQAPVGGQHVRQGTIVTLTISQGPGSTTVPSVAQLTQAAAERTLAAYGLSAARILHESSQTIPQGEVTRTDPITGTPLPKGSSVTLYISSGKPLVDVPVVTGESEADAKVQLQTAGFSYSTTTQQSSSVTAGNVISQSPDGGNAVYGSTVSLVIATKPPPPPPPATASVPGVVGFTAGAAAGDLRGAGFRVSEQQKDTTKPNEQGIVLDQSPGGGQTVTKGSTVTIVVGHYKPAPHRTTTTTPAPPTTTTTPAPPPATTTTTST